MIVNLDTDRLQEMMALLQSANSNIDSAAEKLLSITTHNGWACKERYTINDYVLENRKLAKALQADCANFCAVAKTVADDFVTTEKSISDMFSSVEAALAAILSNPVGSVIINSTVPGVSMVKGGSAISKNVWKTVTDVIKRWKKHNGGFQGGGAGHQFGGFQGGGAGHQFSSSAPSLTEIAMVDLDNIELMLK